MRYVWLILSVLSVLSLLVAGCSSAPPQASDAGPSSVTSAAPAPADPMRVTVGQQFAVASPSGVAQAKVTFTAVEPRPVCTTRFGDPGQPAGIYVAVEMDVQTEPTVDPSQLTYPSTYDFTEVKPDGYTKSDVAPASDLCTADREKFGPLAASSKYRGWVLLDVTSPASVLVFKPHFMTAASSPSWSVTIPAPTSTAPAPTTTEPPTTTAEPETTSAGLPGGNPGGPRSRGVALVSCPADQEPNTGLYADGQYDYAPECLASRRATPTATTPAVDSGPGCGQRAVNAGVFNPSCSEYQGYLDPGTAGGRAPSSGDTQTQYGCQQGYITGPQCDPYR